jgi:hypothetical protein
VLDSIYPRGYHPPSSQCLDTDMFLIYMYIYIYIFMFEINKQFLNDIMY